MPSGIGTSGLSPAGSLGPSRAVDGIVAVRREANGGTYYGTGYRIESDKVLTCRHVVDGRAGYLDVQKHPHDNAGAGADEIKLIQVGVVSELPTWAGGVKVEWRNCTAVWRSEEHDVALITFDSSELRPFTAVLRALDLSQTTDFHTVGFPACEQTKLRDNILVPRSLSGSIAPPLCGARLSAEVNTTYKDVKDWGGFSGAPLLEGHTVLGVVAQVAPQVSGALEAVSCVRFAHDSGFQEARGFREALRLQRLDRFKKQLLEALNVLDEEQRLSLARELFCEDGKTRTAESILAGVLELPGPTLWLRLSNACVDQCRNDALRNFARAAVTAAPEIRLCATSWAKTLASEPTGLVLLDARTPAVAELVMASCDERLSLFDDCSSAPRLTARWSIRPPTLETGRAAEDYAWLVVDGLHAKIVLNASSGSPPGVCPGRLILGSTEKVRSDALTAVKGQLAGMSNPQNRNRRTPYFVYRQEDFGSPEEGAAILREIKQLLPRLCIVVLNSKGDLESELGHVYPLTQIHRPSDQDTP